jgi:hypothetical protein
MKPPPAVFAVPKKNIFFLQVEGQALVDSIVNNTADMSNMFFTISPSADVISNLDELFREVVVIVPPNSGVLTGGSIARAIGPAMLPTTMSIRVDTDQESKSSIIRITVLNERVYDFLLDVPVLKFGDTECETCFGMNNPATAGFLTISNLGKGPLTSVDLQDQIQAVLEDVQIGRCWLTRQKYNGYPTGFGTLMVKSAHEEKQLISLSGQIPINGQRPLFTRHQAATQRKKALKDNPQPKRAPKPWEVEGEPGFNLTDFVNSARSAEPSPGLPIDRMNLSPPREDHRGAKRTHTVPQKPASGSNSPEPKQADTHFT